MKNLSNENVIHVKKDGFEYLQFKKLLEYENKIKHLYSIGLDENFRTSDKTNLDKALEGYEKVIKELGGSIENVVKANQTHSKNVAIVKEKLTLGGPDIDNEEYKDTDALITAKKDFLLSTTNADCILILIYDKTNNIIANVHSGWRGTTKQIVKVTIEKMIEEYGSEAKDFICAFAPSIRKCHFEVDREVKEIFEKEFSEFSKLQLEKIITKQDGKDKWNIDTILINKIILKNLGIVDENIIDSNICSVCNCNQIHSYRAEKEGYKLNTAVIKLD